MSIANLFRLRRMHTAVPETVPARRRALTQLGAMSVASLAAASATTTRAQSVFGATSKAALSDRQGLGGAWYNPSTSGQGIFLEVYPDLLGEDLGVVAGAWFTFDTTPGGTSAQRWYTFNGALTNNQSQADLSILMNTGGNFDAQPVTFSTTVGSAQIRFTDCTTATLDYTFDDGRSGSIPLQRVMSDNTCAGGASSSVQADYAFSGAWYDPATSGQGLMVEVNPVAGKLAFGWFTYAVQGQSAGAQGLRWFTAEGDFEDGARSASLTLYATIGGRFDAADSVTTTAVGSVVLSFSSCELATLTYRFDAGELTGLSGTINLQRLGASPAACSFGSSCALIPSETQGPYPLLSVLSNTALQRSDITEGKSGVPLTLILNLVDINDGCSPIADAWIYAWHCDKDGVYSGYSNQTGGVNATGQVFLRGIQRTNSRGQVVFQTLYPGWYAGRITHIHFQVYLSTLSGSATVTSQVAFPQAVTQAVYASSLYASRGQNTSVTSFAQDNVFSDGTAYQMASVAGSPSAGYAATLTVGVRGG